jgi:hypothetical protein
MPHNHEWQTRIKAVAREYLAIRQATDRFWESAQRDPLIIRASENLSGTSIIRLYAEFETGLRSYWDQARDSNPRTRDLLDGLAALCRIPDEQKKNAHAVRDYRNSLVHERQEQLGAISIAVARGHLCRFMSFLPAKW